MSGSSCKASIISFAFVCLLVSVSGGSHFHFSPKRFRIPPFKREPANQPHMGHGTQGTVLRVVCVRVEFSQETEPLSVFHDKNPILSKKRISGYRCSVQLMRIYCLLGCVLERKSASAGACGHSYTVIRMLKPMAAPLSISFNQSN